MQEKHYSKSGPGRAGQPNSSGGPGRVETQIGLGRAGLVSFWPGMGRAGLSKPGPLRALMTISLDRMAFDPKTTSRRFTKLLTEVPKKQCSYFIDRYLTYC